VVNASAIKMALTKALHDDFNVSKLKPYRTNLPQFATRQQRYDVRCPRLKLTFTAQVERRLSQGDGVYFIHLSCTRSSAAILLLFLSCSPCMRLSRLAFSLLASTNVDCRSPLRFTLLNHCLALTVEFNPFA
jgi:hypothetical protein